MQSLVKSFGSESRRRRFANRGARTSDRKTIAEAPPALMRRELKRNVETMAGNFNSESLTGRLLAAPIDGGALTEVLLEFLTANGFKFVLIDADEISDNCAGAPPPELEDRTVVAIVRASDELPTIANLLSQVIDGGGVAPTSD